MRTLDKVSPLNALGLLGRGRVAVFAGPDDALRLLRVRDGQITEYQVFRDRLDTLRQLGATITLPTPAAAQT
jgi:hypothetical protein